MGAGAAGEPERHDKLLLAAESLSATGALSVARWYNWLGDSECKMDLLEAEAPFPKHFWNNTNSLLKSGTSVLSLKISKKDPDAPALTVSPVSISTQPPNWTPDEDEDRGVDAGILLLEVDVETEIVEVDITDDEILEVTAELMASPAAVKFPAAIVEVVGSEVLVLLSLPLTLPEAEAVIEVEVDAATVIDAATVVDAAAVVDAEDKSDANDCEGPLVLVDLAVLTVLLVVPSEAGSASGSGSELDCFFGAPDAFFAAKMARTIDVGLVVVERSPK